LLYKLVSSLLVISVDMCGTWSGSSGSS